MYPSNTHLGLEWEEVAIGSPDSVLGAIGPLHQDHVDVALVRETLVHTVHLTASDVGCTWVGKREGRERKREREGEREGKGEREWEVAKRERELEREVNTTKDNKNN